MKSFDLTAGTLCLDFANTLSGRGGESPVERLGGYPELLAWARQAGAIDRRRAAALERRAAAAAAAAVVAAVVGRGLVLREALFRAFAAVAAGSEPEAADLAALNRELGRALSRMRVAATRRGGEDRDGFEWHWEEGSGDDLDRPLWPVARSAAELLTGPDLATVRECAAGDCRWLFLDRSRNRSRRWCDMKVCGNRVKARRHYRRRQTRAES